jgi:GTP pyrophosphokinase
VIDLPAGATPVDFAYALHTDLGHRCRGAKVDGQMVPLDKPLASGQRVEIVAAKSGGPSRDWLLAEHGFVTTNRARHKIRQWFNAKALAETVATGRAKVEKELKRTGAAHTNLEELASRLGFKKPDDLFAAVAREEVNLRQLRVDAPAVEPQIEKKKKTKSSEKGSVLIVGMDSLMTQLARCCKPVPPDAIRGFVTRGKGVSVHREDCTSFKRLAEKDPERLIETGWGKGEGSYTVDMTVTAADRRGLLRDVGDALAREKINVSAVRTQNRDELAFMRFTFEIADLAQLKRAFAAVRQLKGVIRVARG